MESLVGAGIVVTRPGDRGQALCRRIAAAGGQALAFPTLDIRPVEPPVIDLDEQAADIVVFTSVPAVEQGLEAVASWITTKTRIAAIGSATANALESQGCRDILVPATRQESEGLLELPEFRQLQQKRILVVKGRGGRDLLRKTLAARGAVVGTAIVYSRQPLRQTAAPLLNWWRSGQLHAIVSTSASGLEALHDLLDKEGRDFLESTLVVVPTTRMIKLAKELGIAAEPLVSTGASDDAVFEALETWWRSSRTGRERDIE